MQWGNTSLALASNNGHHETVEVLLQHKADVNAKDYEGRTPLHVAAINDAFLSAKYLLTHGADINLTDSLGRTVIDEALRTESHQMLALLREH